MPDGDLQRTLQSLACGKFRVLNKMPKGRDVNPTDKFAFNEAFTCPLAKIKIMQVASKVETTKEREETQEQVDEERKHQIEVNKSIQESLVADVAQGLHRPDHEGPKDDEPQ